MTVDPSKPPETDAQLASRWKVTARTVRRWRAAGAPLGDDAALDAWIGSRKAGPDAPVGTVATVATVAAGGEAGMTQREILNQRRIDDLAERVRQRRRENEVEEGKLVPRAWVAECIHKMSGSINSLRSRSEAEHPLRFAEAAGDVAQCRVVISGIWDEIAAALQALGRRLKDTAPAASR